MNMDKQIILNEFDRTIKEQVEKIRDSFELYDELSSFAPTATEKTTGESIALFAIYTILKNFQRSKTIEEIRRKIIEQKD